tara:strand:+ start:10 stop:423 length:414 start_codon:yes stop_codon:yes gene_type:complete
MKKLLLFGVLALSINVFAQSTVKIDDLEVMTKDLGKMNWEEAKKACKNLGDGWRLPSLDELNLIYENKEMFGGFITRKSTRNRTFSFYWTSTLEDTRNPNGDVCFVVFAGGTPGWGYGGQEWDRNVRAVRGFYNFNN